MQDFLTTWIINYMLLKADPLTIK